METTIYPKDINEIRYDKKGKPHAVLKFSWLRPTIDLVCKDYHKTFIPKDSNEGKMISFWDELVKECLAKKLRDLDILKKDLETNFSIND